MHRTAHDTWSAETRHALWHQRHTVAGRDEAEHRVQAPRFLHDRRFQPSLSADRDEQVEVSGRVSPRKQEEPLTTKGPEGECAALREAVTFGKRDDQWLAH